MPFSLSLCFDTVESRQITARSGFSELEQQTAILCLNSSLSDVQTQRVYVETIVLLNVLRRCRPSRFL